MNSNNKLQYNIQTLDDLSGVCLKELVLSSGLSLKM